MKHNDAQSKRDQIKRKIKKTLSALCAHRKKCTSHHNHGHSDDKVDNYRADHSRFPGNRERKRAR